MRTLFTTAIIFIFISCKEDSDLRGPLTINAVNEIRYNETLSDSNISIRFAEVIEDSRCPMNVNCVWQGNAGIRFNFYENRSNIPFDLFVWDMPNLRMNVDTVLSNYRFELVALEPYPESTGVIAPSDYIAQIRIERLNTPSQ